MSLKCPSDLKIFFLWPLNGPKNIFIPDITKIKHQPISGWIILDNQMQD